MSPSQVALAHCRTTHEQPYPQFPYGPGSAYPEIHGPTADSPNEVYDAVRRSLHLLQLDRENFGTARWNPLGELIQPGQQVLIKPNWVYHENPAGGLSSLVTHTSVVRAVIDYVLLALKGHGRVIIGDAPIQSADFDVLMRRIAIKRLLEQIDTSGVDFEIRDFRENVCLFDEKGFVAGHRKLTGDADGYCTVNLGTMSLLQPVSRHSRRFRVTNYDPRTMQAHHGTGRHEYLIAGAVLQSDVVINIPKLKTHRKAGLTCCLKNRVGINGSKDYLPHHRLGCVRAGGDEYQYASLCKAIASRIIDHIESAPGRPGRSFARLALRLCRRMAYQFARDRYSEGSWHGNDTIWRTVIDLNRVLEFARPDGTISESPQRRVFNIVDGVVVGAGEGPLRCDGVYAGMVMAGESAAAVDNFAALLVGLDPLKIPLIRNACRLMQDQLQHRFDKRLVTDDLPERQLAPEDIQPVVCIEPPEGWVGHVELEHRRQAQTSGRRQRPLVSAEAAEE